MHEFELFRPEKLADAWQKKGPSKVFKAAGIDLLDRLKERVERPKTLVDLLPLASSFLGAVQEEKTGAVTLGALVTLTEIADAKELRGSAFAAITRAAAETATPQIRNRATLGGNLLQKTRCWYFRSQAFKCAHDGRGDTCLAEDGENRYHSIMGYDDCVRVHPSNLAPALLVFDAQIALHAGETSLRTLPLAELFPKTPSADAPEHLAKENEILTFVQIPPQPKGTASAYRASREKQSFDWPTTAAAVRLVLATAHITDASICLGAGAPVPMLRPKAAAMLKGKAPSHELFAKVAKQAFADAEPLSQNEYKIKTGQAILIDALTAAARQTRKRR